MERANYNLLIKRRKSYETVDYILLFDDRSWFSSPTADRTFRPRKITVPIEALSKPRESCPPAIQIRVNIQEEGRASA